jgi:hypothetical protein
VKIAQLGHQGPSERWNPRSITWGFDQIPFGTTGSLSGLSAGEYSSPPPTPVIRYNGGLRFRLGLKTDICHKGRFPRLVGHAVVHRSRSHHGHPFALAIDQQDRIWVTSGFGDHVTRFPASDPTKAETFKAGFLGSGLAVVACGAPTGPERWEC